MSTAAPTVHEEMIGWFRVILDPDQVVELRTVPPGKALLFRADQVVELVAAALKLKGRKGVYFTLNPIEPSMLESDPPRAAADIDVTRRRLIFIDCDPKRPADTSSTDAEKAAALAVAERIRDELRAEGWPEPILADSGNGYHLLYLVDLPADDGELVRRCLLAAAARYGTDAVDVDTSVYNPSRICKLYGTVGRKGEPTRERPHRRSRVVELPATFDVVPGELLEALADSLVVPARNPVASPAKPMAKGGSRVARYVTAALAGETEKMTSSPAGERNNQLFKSTVALAELIGPDLGEGTVREFMTAAAAAAQLEGREVARTIESGIKKGLANPRRYPEDDDGHHRRNGSTNGAIPSANGNGHGTAHAGGEAGDDGPEVHETPDDPHRLARVFLDGGYRGPDGLELRYYQGEYLGWNGAYRSLPEGDVRAKLTTSIKGEFNHLNVSETDEWEERGKTDAKGKGCPRPSVRKVTSGLVNNAVGALAGYSLLDHSIRQPSWLMECPPFPADEVLPTRNALVHLPGLVADIPRSIIPPTPRFFGGYCLDYDFDRDAAEPINWLTFLGARPITDKSKVRLQLWPDDPQSIDALQEWMGYHLLPDTTQQKIAMVIGPRRCGKGTIARILAAMIGPENVANPTLAGLASHFGLNSLINKPCAIIPDAKLSGKTDATLVVEHLLSISGEDAQTIDRKHLGHWNGWLPTRFTFISNELPRLPDTSGALTGRMIIFRLTRSFYGQEDKALTALLKTELPGILLWAIEGWLRLRDRGHFLQPESGQEMIAELEELSSPVGAFLKERCIVELGREVMAKTLYTAWKGWCSDKGRDHPGDEQVFGRNLRTVMPNLNTPSRRLPDGSRKRFYEGIDLQFLE